MAGVIFVKRTILERFDNELKAIDLSKGIMGTLLNSFYRTEKGSKRLPYKSISSILNALRWPNDLVYIGEYPAADENSWSDNCQGVTNDGKNWYITQDRYINRASITRDLKSMDNVGFIPPDLLTIGYSHLGDLDYHEGNLYIPLEGQESGLDAKILVFNTTIAESDPVYTTSAFVTPPHKQAPWCAINPLNGHLYTSDSHSNFLYVYERKFSGSGELLLTMLGKFELFDKKGKNLYLRRIQGGVFSKNGHLYLVSDDTDSHEASGIHAFDMITGRRFLHKFVEYDPYETYLGFSEPEELEGIDIWDLDSGVSPSIRGQIHLLMVDNDPSIDDIYFKHFRVSTGDENKI
jgi:hypothetical protein